MCIGETRGRWKDEGSMHLYIHRQIGSSSIRGSSFLSYLLTETSVVGGTAADDGPPPPPPPAPALPLASDVDGGAAVHRSSGR